MKMPICCYYWFIVASYTKCGVVAVFKILGIPVYKRIGCLFSICGIVFNKIKGEIDA